MDSLLAMEGAVHLVAGYLSLALNAVALVMLAVGAVKSLAAICLAFSRGQVSDMRVRAIFIEFARWLVAALTFQLGADIAETTVTPTWDELGRLAAIALIRTLLTYFLDRDLEKAVGEQLVPGERKQAQAIPK
jgi:uncharacterized membrane protein